MATESPETRELADGLVSGTVGDRCVSCGTPLSSDQRYCVVCGERRGAPRFALPAPDAAAVQAPPPLKAPRRSRGGSGTTLVAGVATLLIALLVGVLIGHDTSNSNGRTVTVPTKIITVNVGGGSTAGTASTPASTSSSTSGSKATGQHQSSKAKSTKSAKSSSAKIPAKTAKQLSSAAKKVTGGSGGAPPTVTVGGSCTAGTPGCNGKTKKFTGSFFGGG
jgi:hypothetical protein